MTLGVNSIELPRHFTTRICGWSCITMIPRARKMAFHGRFLVVVWLYDICRKYIRKNTKNHDDDPTLLSVLVWGRCRDIVHHIAAACLLELGLKFEMNEITIGLRLQQNGLEQTSRWKLIASAAFYIDLTWPDPWCKCAGWSDMACPYDLYQNDHWML